MENILANRRPMFISDTSMLAYLLDPNFRGIGLDAPQRRKALQHLSAAAELAQVEVGIIPSNSALQLFHLQAPTVDQVLSFIEKQSPYDLEATCSPFQLEKQLQVLGGFSANLLLHVQYWSVLMPDSPISPLGASLAALPSSQAMVERMFSSAGWQAAERENLLSEHLAEEVHLL